MNKGMSIEAALAELQKPLSGPHAKCWSFGPAVRTLIAALEQAQQNESAMESLLDGVTRSRDDVVALAREMKKQRDSNASGHAKTFERISYLETALEQALRESKEQQQRIAELESQRGLAFMACNRWRDKCAEAESRVAELENDEVRQRLANAEHQLHMAELAKHNLKESRRAQFKKRRAAERRFVELSESQKKLREGMAAIYNVICADGASTSLSAILTFVKRAFEESAAANGTVEGSD